MNFRRPQTPVDWGTFRFTPTQKNHADAFSYSPHASAYDAQRARASRPDEIAATALANRYAEKAAIIKGESDVMSQGLNAMGSVRAAEAQADGARGAARSKANGEMIGSTLQMIGTIGGALLLSDASTKENVETIDDGLSVIKKLKPKTYNYRPEWQGYSNRKHSGFIAQEYQTVIPEGTYNDEESGKLVVDLAEVIAPLVRAVQQLEARITELEAK